MKRKNIKVCIVVGTRPEIIKMAPIIRYCKKAGIGHFVLNTAQHYDFIMSKVFFKQLGLPAPKYSLDASTGTHAEQTAKIVVFVEKVLMREKPDVVLVEGDTNTVFSGALAAVKLHINIGHVEAGLRSFDLRMPEEMNRILTDHMSNFLFAPTGEARKNLLKDGLPDKDIYVVGNTIADAVHQNLRLARKPLWLEKRLGFGLKKDGYFLVTAHRPENVDSRHILNDILEAFGAIFKKYRTPFIYPIHPRTKKMMRRFKLSAPEGVFLTDPISYLDFLYLLRNSKLVFTDSGGVQEESCIMGVPCVTMRLSTERPETLWAGSNIISGTNPLEIARCAAIMMKRSREWKNPFGDGRSGERIAEILLKRLG